jgi:hypothetical protein
MNGEMTDDEYIQGLILALAESPKGPQKEEDLAWLAGRLT